MRRLILHNVAVIWASSPRLLPKTEFSDTLLVEGRKDKKAPSPALPADGGGKISRGDNK